MKKLRSFKWPWLWKKSTIFC